MIFQHSSTTCRGPIPPTRGFLQTDKNAFLTPLCGFSVMFRKYFCVRIFEHVHYNASISALIKQHGLHAQKIFFFCVSNTGLIYCSVSDKQDTESITESEKLIEGHTA